MLTLIDLNSKEIEFKNSTELKKFLSTQNPGTVKKYKDQLKKLLPDIVVEGLGSTLKIYRLNKNKEVWYESVIENALEYEFIKREQLEKSLDILSKYKDEAQFFSECCESKDTLTKILVDASQI